jgi:large subunit GTPase 1
VRFPFSVLFSHALIPLFRSLQDNKSLLLTPFERNLEVWRQLWRTVERSDLVVQIVDARNPLNFRSEDLTKYVAELSTIAGTNKPRRKNLLLINKSDLLTQKQRFVFLDPPLPSSRFSH